MGGKLMTNNIDIKFNLSYLNVIAEMYSASTGVNAWHAGPMVASSVLTLLLIIIYFINKNVDKKEKIINGVSLFILATTFVFNPLCILFHGLTNPNCFNYRHAFIFVFFALNLAISSCSCLPMLGSGSTRSMTASTSATDSRTTFTM